MGVHIMKTETMTVYRCDYCGACFNKSYECKEHENEHFDINLVPHPDQHFKIGDIAPSEVILTGYGLVDKNPVLKRFIYTLKGEKKND